MWGHRFSPDEADYRTLIAALGDLLERIAVSRRDPRAFSVTIHSRRELVIKQLMGVYKVHAPALRPLHAEAHGLLDRSNDVTLLWRRDDSIMALLGR